MIPEKEAKRLGKFLIYILRHHPEKFGIVLDENGWAEVDTLLKATNKYGIEIDNEILKYIVATNAKKRFAFNDSFDKIRASQGHSVTIELGYTSQQPPDILFHGTGDSAVISILQTGLQKRDRQQVHLSADVETAKLVGRRHGKPFVFKVLAEQMYRDKFEFFLSDNGVWLTDHVPVIYLQIPGR